MHLKKKKKKSLQPAHKHTPTVQKAASVHSTQNVLGEKRPGKSSGEYETSLLAILRPGRGAVAKFNRIFLCLPFYFYSSVGLPGPLRNKYISRRDAVTRRQTQNEVFHHPQSRRRNLCYDQKKDKRLIQKVLMQDVRL